jgi:hypothetical protein
LFRRLETTALEDTPGRGSGRLSLFQNHPTKNGSDRATSGPLFIFITLFDLLVAYLLTLLLIGSPLYFATMLILTSLEIQIRKCLFVWIDSVIPM